MLNTISWQQYWTALTLLLLAWYSYVILRYYRNELFNRFKPNIGPLPLVASAPVLGTIKSEQNILDPEELHFSSLISDDISDHSLPPGPTDELLGEAQTLTQAFIDTANKTEFLALLELLLSKYEPHKDEIDLKVIRPLAKRLPFPIEEHEWPTFLNQIP